MPTVYTSNMHSKCLKEKYVRSTWNDFNRNTHVVFSVNFQLLVINLIRLLLFLHNFCNLYGKNHKTVWFVAETSTFQTLSHTKNQL